MIDIETILNLVQFLAMVVFGYSILFCFIKEGKFKELLPLDKIIISIGIGWLAVLILSIIIPNDVALTSGIVFTSGSILILIKLFKKRKY